LLSARSFELRSTGNTPDTTEGSRKHNVRLPDPTISNLILICPHGKTAFCIGLGPIRRLAMFDTLRYSKILEAVGITREHAEAHVKIIAEIIEGELATKRDIENLKKDLEKNIELLESRLIIRISTIVGGIVTFAIAITAAISKLI
jgi:hypothetical protein